ncbi:M20/M25/M40 family metallo-hydrolase [Lysinibacter cavernae]|uniref:Carboxypeptidase PM20D1 n=1 Tax=Lysinibacter cavernae TaxID=1640652 RepID=A0A7X5R0T8_9MICO|nr:M20/M25/M40 family metallo-hydrolase [Lysinibacter cavernae]NIH53506.1 carboxypeptidase PM20D1 [Lysinibacter cavernae]
MSDSAVDRFRTLLRIPTVSPPLEADTDWASFQRFREALADLYPSLHANLEHELVAEHSILFRWKGASSEQPSVLMAHYDVVPATDEGWTHPPFSATLTGEGTDDATIWSRGAIDDKGALVTLLEAAEKLSVDGFVPKHDIYLSFGHNEEVQGSGAQAIAKLFTERGVTPAFVLDEGGAVVEGVFPGVEKPIAVVGVSEKGIMNVRLTVRQQGGHASTPPDMTATARLARAIDRLRRNQFPAKLTATNVAMVSILGAEATGPLAYAAKYPTAAKSLLPQVFARMSDETRAMVRTTMAVTQLEGSLAANALAESAKAIVNVRIAVGSSVAESIRHLTKAIHDPLVSITIDEANEPSRTSPHDGPAWEHLAASIRDTFDNTIVTPYIMLGASDARHFAKLSAHVYRFSPFDLTTDERGALHAVDERIRVSSYLRGISFYERLVAGL